MAVNSDVSSPEKLRAALNTVNYKAKTDDQIKTQAQNEYANQLSSALLNAKQNYDSTALDINNQKLAANIGYDQQVDNQRTANMQSLSSVDRNNMRRGMGRSSYNMSAMANTEAAGNNAINAIEQNRTNTLAGLDSKLTAAAQARAQSENNANLSYQNSVIQRIQSLKDSEFQKQQKAESDTNSLLLQLYSLLK